MPLHLQGFHQPDIKETTVKRISMILATLTLFTPACDETDQDEKSGGYQSRSELVIEVLDANLRLCAEESAHGPSSCAEDALAAHSETRTDESPFDFTDEIEWVEPESEFSNGVAPRAACWGEVKVSCFGHECCGTGGGCATFCKKMKPPQQLPGVGRIPHSLGLLTRRHRPAPMASSSKKAKVDRAAVPEGEFELAA